MFVMPELLSEDENEKIGGSFWSSCQRRKHGNVGWEMVVNATCNEL